jgi:hypothetical protein
LATRNLTMACAAWRVGNREFNQRHFDIFSLAPHSVNRHRRLTRRSWLMCLGTSPLQELMIAPALMRATEACPLRSWTHGCGLPPQATRTEGIYLIGRDMTRHLTNTCNSVTPFLLRRDIGTRIWTFTGLL